MNKKLYNYIVISIFCITSIKAQNNVADFENLSLNPETYWDGSDLTGTSLASNYTTYFDAGIATFNNVWNSSWSYWKDGWMYSNNSDSTTSGFTNLSSSIVGQGANSSSNYAIGINNTYIKIDTSNGSAPISGMYITNTTYAHNSMRDGDQFAKKFTNADQDYFKLTITSFDNGMNVDSIEFLLADYTHSDSTLDYILNDWQYIDISSLGVVDSIKFSLTSSDNGTFGMNTPAFFALDDISQNSNTFGFENLSLNTNSFFDGSDLTGTPDNPDYLSNFSSGNVNLNNLYNSTWSYWKSGWIYSNTTDSITSGFSNLSSSKAGSGYATSENYVIGKSGSTITYDNPTNFTAFISNSTYAANSMRDGDSFARKFSNINQDYLKLQFYGYLNGAIVDSNELYLADFTHSDSTLDYIVNVTPGFDWQYISLPNFAVDSVTFKLLSSDVGAFGMNTPDFFCMDNVGSSPLSIKSENEVSFNIYPNPTSDIINLNNINNLTNYSVKLYDIYGKLIINDLRNVNSIDISNLSKGQYLLNITSEDKIQSEIIIKK
jgi:hypothetical protein